jgi:hypothetical protein
LNQLASLHDEDEDSSSEDEDEEEQGNRGREFAPAVKTSDTIDTDPSFTSPQQAAQDLASTLRNRASATNPSQNPTAGSEKLSTEQVLESANRDQDLLTTSLVTLAKSLKESSMQFASSLESEKEVMRRAESGLDKNSMGMEAAGNRMSTLRRMTEGKGWWGRIKLYAIIAGLWMAAFLLVFVGPKLRRGHPHHSKPHKKPSSTWAAWENPFCPAKYSTFASPERKSLAYSEGRTDDLSFRLGNTYTFAEERGGWRDYMVLVSEGRRSV